MGINIIIYYTGQSKVDILWIIEDEKDRDMQFGEKK
jgi:hypothetical protein